MGSRGVGSATNTFPHIQNLGDFIQGLRTCSGHGGVFCIEMHYLLDIIEQVAFDTVYHEHVLYWALGPMKRLFEAHGMTIVDAERLPAASRPTTRICATPRRRRGAF